MMPELLELLQKVTKGLEDVHIPYMVSGSIIMSAYVEPRFTNDIDIVIHLESEDVERFLPIFDAGFYLDHDVVRQEVTRKGMFNALSQPDQVKFDFIVRKDGPFKRHEFERRQRVKIDGIEVWGATIEDLIISKFIWIQELESELQKRDLGQLLLAENIDREYIKQWIERLGLKTYGLMK
jgi:predicted nucleotidyltransferase